jgi:hypothetical protein
MPGRYGVAGESADACTRGLAADDVRVRAAIGPSPPGWRAIERYVVVPSTRRPQILAPARAPGAAASAVTQFSNGAPARTRLAAAAAAHALRAGVAQRLIRGRASISVAPGVGDADLPGLVLSHHLARALDLPRADLAVRGRRPPERKAVVQVSAPAGGSWRSPRWAGTTCRALVAAEAGALRDLADRPDGIRGAGAAARRRLGRMAVTAVVPAWAAAHVRRSLHRRPHAS